MHFAKQSREHLNEVTHQVYFDVEIAGKPADGKHVVFGKVLSGMDVVYKIEAQGRLSCTPKNKVVIVASGEISVGRATT
ncbi:hypothetical protein GOBAR_AA07343 [Gossypium barbadense]|uniref:PPIase cyclophilin-type domain-containing protein n=1 Tax=Gossypium barbadense TaxID=3634 RepID=A0A2P5YCM9_GOSBA|nr:hypothetical protein GOBAR_AA07343 [Gossypium barbadense]